MTDDQDTNELWGTSSTAETVGAAKPSFFKTNQTIIVSSLVLLVLSGAAVTLLLQGLQKPEDKLTTKVVNEAPPVNQEPSTQSNVVDIVKKTTEMFPAIAPSDLWESKEKAAVNRAAIIELQNHTHALRDSYEGLSKLQASLKSRLELLRNSQEGARLTSDPELVTQYVGVAKEFEDLTRYDLGVESFLTNMNGLFASVVEANAAKAFHPQTETIDQAKQFDKSVRQRNTALSDLADRLEALLKSVQSNPPGVSLAVAIANAEKGRADSLAKRIADISTQARAQSWETIENKIMTEEADFIKSQTELKVAELRGKSSQNRQLAAEISAKVKKAKEDEAVAVAKRKLEGEFKVADAEIRTYLISLTSDGRTNRGNASGIGPVSYSAIVGSGALGGGNQGIIAMSNWCGSNGRWNRMNSRADDSKLAILGLSMIAEQRYESHIQFFEKAQQLLKKFGPLMVEKGLLAD